MRAATTGNLRYFGGALGIHVLLVALLLSVGLIHRRPIPPQLSLKAVLVDRSVLNQLAKQAPAPAKPPEADAAELQRQQEQRQQAQQAELLKQQQAQQQKLKEQQAKQLLLKKQQAEAEKQKQLEAQRKAEAEQKRLADIKQKQHEAELKRQAELNARAQKAREAELAAQLAAEEARDNAVNAGLLNQYVAMIQQKVMRYWIKPPTAKFGLECEVKVTQAMGGTVLSVTLGRCNGDQAVRASIEAAVNAASPLPTPPDARLFDRNLSFIFKPTE